jgi:hypothetical protein
MAAFAWPDGKRLAVTVNAKLETRSEGKAPPYSVQASPKAGAVDLADHRAAEQASPARHLLRQRPLRRDFPRRGAGDRRQRP